MIESLVHLMLPPVFLGYNTFKKNRKGSIVFLNAIAYVSSIFLCLRILIASDLVESQLDLKN